MSSRNDKDRLMILIVIAILTLSLWLVRCSNSARYESLSADSCVIVLSDTLPDTTSYHRTPKEKSQKQQHRPVERNFLDEKVSI